MTAPASEVRWLLDLLDQGFDTRSWHGPNLRGALRGVTLDEAQWRPAPGRHCIWEVALHCAYWKYAVHRRLVGGIRRGSFPRVAADWPVLPDDPDSQAFKADIMLLETYHDKLRNAVAAASIDELRVEKGSWLLADHVRGIAAHDFYHAGQIQLLKRLQRA